MDESTKATCLSSKLQALTQHLVDNHLTSITLIITTCMYNTQHANPLSMCIKAYHRSDMIVLWLAGCLTVVYIRMWDLTNEKWERLHHHPNDSSPIGQSEIWMFLWLSRDLQSTVGMLAFMLTELTIKHHHKNVTGWTLGLHTVTHNDDR